jgi:hypothetical protein
MKREKWIPIDQCEDGYLYIIDARNSSIGVYIEREKGFVINRFRWGLNSLFVENHWDTGEPYGTVRPLEKIEQVPEDLWNKLKNNKSPSALYDRNMEAFIF